MSKTLVYCCLGDLLSQPITVQGNKLSNIHGRLCLESIKERWFALFVRGQGLQKEIAWQIEICLYVIDNDICLFGKGV